MGNARNAECISIHSLEITGIFRGVPVRVNPRQRTIKALFRTYLDVVHIKRSDQKRLAVDRTIIGANESVVSYDEGDEIHIVNTGEEEEIRALSRQPDVYDTLSRSLAPSIYELDDVKKGILLQLFGGTNKTFTKSGSPRYRYNLRQILAYLLHTDTNRVAFICFSTTEAISMFYWWVILVQVNLSFYIMYIRLRQEVSTLLEKVLQLLV